MTSAFFMNRAQFISTAIGLVFVVLALSGCRSAPIIPANPLPVLEQNQVRPVAWQFNVEGGDAGLNPIVVDDALYIASQGVSKGEVIKIDIYGKALWRTALEKTITAGVGANTKYVAVALEDGGLVVLSANDGQKLWMRPLPTEVMGPPLVIDDIIITRTISGLYHGWNAKTGTNLWSLSRPTGALSVRWHQPMVVDGAFVLVGATQGEIFAIHAKTGQVAWQRKFSPPQGTSEVERLADVVSAPVVKNGVVCVAAFQGKTACLESQTGKPLWREDYGSSSGLSMNHHLVIVIDMKDTVQALSLDNGKKQWQYDALFNRFVGPPLIVKDQVVFGDGLGYIYWLDIADGQLKGIFSTQSATTQLEHKKNPQRIKTAPVIFGDLTIVQSQDGIVYAFR